jgi:probable HAF family extracellular repeat protein
MLGRRTIRLATLAGVLLLSVVAGYGWGTPYVLTDLGTLGGDKSLARDINNNGEVVGFADTSSGHEHAFIYRNGTIQDLGQVAGSDSDAESINDSGQIVGSYTSGSITRAYRTAAYQPINPLTDGIGTLGGSATFATGINNNGDAVGYGYTGNGFMHAFFYSSGTMRDLGAISGTMSFAQDVNNSGQIVGNTSVNSQNLVHAFFYSGGTMRDLGTLGGTSFANCVNESGRVVGCSKVAGNYSRAYVYSGSGPMMDIGTLGGKNGNARGINDYSQIVGYADTASNDYPIAHAFLYTGTGPMLDLNNLIAPDSGWTLTNAEAINNAGQIAGYGLNGSGREHAFLLTPASFGDANLDGRVDINDLTVVLASYNQSSGMIWETGDFNNDGRVDINDLTIVLANYNTTSGAGMASVPEPSAIALLLGGAIGLLGYAWRWQA